MSQAASLERCLSEALNNLYNPGYEPEPALQRLLGVSTCGGLRETLSSLIAGLVPDSACPRDAPVRRYHDILRHRFIEGWTLERTAEELGISVRHLSRQQRQAIAWLTRLLIQGPQPDGQPWMAEVRRELDVFMDKSPGTIASVKDVLDRVLQVATPLAASRQTTLVASKVPPDLLVAAPAAFVEQALLVTIDRMTAHQAGGFLSAKATIEAEGETVDDQVRIRITLSPPRTDDEPSDYLVDELLSRQHATRAWFVTESEAICELSLPVTRPAVVLLIEDNEDLYYVYDRYTRGTPYRILHAGDPSDIAHVLRTAHVEIVVLDIMLPDADGWQILTHLHQNPETRSIPVVVCTVVRAQELAEALGAAAYLPKPVRRDEFITALDRVRSRRLPGEHT